MFHCLYNCGSGTPSTQEYHVYPRSASPLDTRLEKGVVCDKCNAYFAKLEKYFIECHPGAFWRMLSVKSTRKGKPPKFVHQHGEVTRKDKAEEFDLTIPLADVRSELLDNGDIQIIGTFLPLPFDSVRISRVLVKIALEFCYTQGDEYNPFNTRFNAVRKYARFGPGKLKYVWFAWKRTQEPQTLPRLFVIQDEKQLPVGILCRVAFPHVAYLVPLPPFVAPEHIGQNLAGWTVVDAPSEVVLEREEVKVMLHRIRR